MAAKHYQQTITFYFAKEKLYNPFYSFQHPLMIKDFAGDITHVTYKEVAILWNMLPGVAANRLSVIRSSLNKARFHRLTVQQYCKAEDISIEEFTHAINRYYNDRHKKAS